ncbi:MAG: hypothetical protein V4754_06625 [Pseudomonadota bacterium]
MKKNIVFAAVLCVSACVQAFPGTVELTRKDGEVSRTLVLSKWSVDKRGVPSFDYRYTQSGANCAYERNGHAVAGFEDNGDSVELEVYHPQDDKGKEGPPVTFFYDRDDTSVVFEMEKEVKNKVRKVAYADRAMKKKFANQCGLTEKSPSLLFKNK